MDTRKFERRRDDARALSAGRLVSFRASIGGFGRHLGKPNGAIEQFDDVQYFLIGVVQRGARA